MPHRRCCSLLLILLVNFAAPVVCADTGTAIAPVQVTVDTSRAPEAAPWGAEAKKVVVKWYPVIAEMLKSRDFRPPAQVRLVFRSGIHAPAFTTRNTITINADHIKRHPDDFGMVVHELTHVVQGYPRGNEDAGWLVEGIADYVRFYLYEPQTKLRPVNPARDHYHDGYRTAAQFLAWIEKKHDPNIIRKLNAVLRQGRYTPLVFKIYTGKSVDDLWSEFIASRAGR